MPGDTDAARLRRYVLSLGSDKRLAVRALRLVRPFFNDASSGTYSLAPAWAIADDAFAAAISGIVGSQVGKLTPISCGKGDGRLARFLAYEQMVCLPMLVYQKHRAVLGADLGEDRYQEFVNVLYECLGEAMR